MKNTAFYKLSDPDYADFLTMMDESRARLRLPQDWLGSLLKHQQGREPDLRIENHDFVYRGERISVDSFCREAWLDYLEDYVEYNECIKSQLRTAAERRHYSVHKFSRRDFDAALGSLRRSGGYRSRSARVCLYTRISWIRRLHDYRNIRYRHHH